MSGAGYCGCLDRRGVPFRHAVEHRMNRREDSLLLRRLRKDIGVEACRQNHSEEDNEPLDVPFHAAILSADWYSASESLRTQDVVLRQAWWKATESFITATFLMDQSGCAARRARWLSGCRTLRTT